MVPDVEDVRGSQERVAGDVALGLEGPARRAARAVGPQRPQPRRDPGAAVRLVRVRVVDRVEFDGGGERPDPVPREDRRRLRRVLDLRVILWCVAIPNVDAGDGGTWTLQWAQNASTAPPAASSKFARPPGWSST